MSSPTQAFCEGDYVLQATAASGTQIHIFCHRTVIKHSHKGYLSDAERAAYREALVWLEQHSARSLQRAIAILEGMGFEVVLVS